MTYVIKLKRTTKSFDGDEGAVLNNANLAYGEAVFLDKYGYMVVGKSNGTTTVGNATRVFKAIPKSMADNGIYYTNYDSTKKFIDMQIVQYNNSNYTETVQSVYPRTKFEAVTNAAGNLNLATALDNKMDKNNPTGTGYLSLNRKSNTTVGSNSVAVGSNTTATSAASFAEGDSTIASGTASHAEGISTKANSSGAHAEGQETIAYAVYSHAEGYKTNANNNSSHAEGTETEASNTAAHAEGDSTIASGTASHAEGYKTAAQGDGSHAEGYSYDSTNQSYSKKTTASGIGAHAEGRGTLASGNYSHAEGTMSVNTDDQTTNKQTIASGVGAHAEGCGTEASGSYSHAQGYKSISSGRSSHSEGQLTTAKSYYAHAEGYQTVAGGSAEDVGTASHAEGSNTTASGAQAHAEGNSTTASGTHSHAEGSSTTASGSQSHAEGSSTTASGSYSHAQGLGTTAQSKSQHVIGEYNVADSSGSATTRGTFAAIVGNGTSSSKSNAAAIDWNGNLYLKGNIYVNGSSANATGGGSLGGFASGLMDSYLWRKSKTTNGISTGAIQTGKSLTFDGSSGNELTLTFGKISQNQATLSNGISLTDQEQCVLHKTQIHSLITWDFSDFTNKQSALIASGKCYLNIQRGDIQGIFCEYVYKITNNTVIQASGDSVSLNNLEVYKWVSTCESQTYLNDFNSNAYPSGTSGGYNYNKFGQLFDVLPKMQEFNYSGSSSGTSTTYKTLTFNFIPKFIIVHGYNGSGTSDKFAYISIWIRGSKYAMCYGGAFQSRQFNTDDIFADPVIRDGLSNVIKYRGINDNNNVYQGIAFG